MGFEYLLETPLKTADIGTDMMALHDMLQGKVFMFYGYTFGAIIVAFIVLLLSPEGAAGKLMKWASVVALCYGAWFSWQRAGVFSARQDACVTRGKSAVALNTLVTRYQDFRCTFGPKFKPGLREDPEIHPCLRNTSPEEFLEDLGKGVWVSGTEKKERPVGIDLTFVRSKLATPDSPPEFFCDTNDLTAELQ